MDAGSAAARIGIDTATARSAAANVRRGMSFKGSVRLDGGQAVEKLWMIGDFPVHRSTPEIFFRRARLEIGPSARRACAFVIRFA
jgi:hypothetical protein